VRSRIRGRGTVQPAYPSVSSLADKDAVSLAEQQVVARAIRVIGDRAEALRWLGTPVRALSYATPISCFDTLEHIDLVESVLDKLEHGVL